MFKSWVLSLLIEARAHCWRLWLNARGKGLLLLGGAGRLPGSAEGLCNAMQSQGKQEGLLAMLCSAAGNAKVSLKAPRITGGSLQVMWSLVMAAQGFLAKR